MHPGMTSRGKPVNRKRCKVGRAARRNTRGNDCVNPDQRPVILEPGAISDYDLKLNLDAMSGLIDDCDLEQKSCEELLDIFLEFTEKKVKRDGRSYSRTLGAAELN
jgi:hypothetical protein